MQDYKLRYQLDPLVKQEVLQKEAARVRATVSGALCITGAAVGAQPTFLLPGSGSTTRQSSCCAPNAETLPLRQCVI